MNFQIGETVRFLNHNHCVYVEVVKVNRKRVKIRNRNGYEQDVYPEKLAKLEEKVCVIHVNNLKYGSVAEKFKFDREKYPQCHSEARLLPHHSRDGAVEEDENGALLRLGEVATQADHDLEQDKINILYNILKGSGE